MGIQSLLSESQKARIALYHEPYLFLELEEAETESQSEPSLEQKRSYFNKLQNPQAYGDLFGEIDEQPTDNKTPPRVSQIGRPSVEAYSTVISRARLEELFDEVLSLYKPYVARTDWARVMSYRTEFLDEASRTTTGARRVTERLQELKFSLMADEKVEFNRA